MTRSERSSASALETFFRPESVAVVGASADERKLGFALVANLRDGFRGRVYPVSRTVESILGYETLPSLAELPEPPDLVLVSIPAEGVPAAVEEAASVGARAAVVLACGFAEAGPSGRVLQERLLEAAHPAGLRIVGPNCMGIIETSEGLNATYFRGLPVEPGPIAFVSQSGAFGGIAFTQLRHHGVGLSRFASIGNMADVTHAELIASFGADDATRIVCAFVEGIPDGGALLEAIGDVARSKPVVVLKAGRSAAGREAAISHTGSLAGDARVWDALLREAGALVVEDSEELFDTAAALARIRTLPRGRRVAVVTISGGPSVLAADACEREGLELPPLERDLEPLREIVPAFASLRNPVDLTAQIEPARYATAVRAVCDSGEIDAVLAVNVGLDLSEFGQAFAAEAARMPTIGYVVAPGVEETFAAAGIPNLPSVERAVRAVARLAEWRSWLDAEREAPRLRLEPSELPDGILDENEAKRLLAPLGFTVAREAVAASIDEALEAASELGYPVCLKVCSSAVAHKTEVGGVELDLRDEPALRAAFERLAGRFPGELVLVQEQVAPGLELILGGRRDPLAGPIVLVGLGGILTEVLDDVAVRAAPPSHQAALDAIAELRGQRLLDGYRGRPGVDRHVLAELLERVGAFLDANPTVLELDLNPIIAGESGLVVVDALLRCDAGLAAARA